MRLKSQKYNHRKLSDPNDDLRDVIRHAHVTRIRSLRNVRIKLRRTMDNFHGVHAPARIVEAEEIEARFPDR